MMANPQEEDILKKNYKFISSLGCGGFGKVILAQHLPTKVQVAIKVLEKEYNEEEYINSEVAIHKSLHHRNIIQFFDSFNTMRTTYLVMEYLEGKDLVVLINEVGCLTEEEARPIFNQLASAVHFLHQRLIAHHDIKLENILLGQGGIVKLCDFGLATQLVEGQMLEDLLGTLPYLAPEILAGKPYDALAGDMWSLGIVFYVLVTGHLPYVESTPEAMYRLITTTPCRIPHHLSRPCYLMLARLLTGYLWFRLTSSRLVELPWLGHIQEHVTPPAKEILPKVVETMLNIGYTCEQVLSSLKDPQSNLTATINILKFKVTSGDSSLQRIIPAVATRVPVTLKRSHSQPALLSRGESTHTHLLHTHTCPEALHYPDNTAPEGDALAPETINPATGDTTVTMMSLDSLADESSSPDPPLNGNCEGLVNMDFTEEEESREPEVPSDPVALKRSHSQPALLSRGESTHTHLLHTHTCPEALHYPDNTAPEGDALAPETINPATGDTTVTMMSLDSLADESSSSNPPLNGNCEGLVNMDFTEEQESREPEVPSDQPQVVPAASVSRPLRGWKLMKKRISSALRALCCCCLPTPPGQTEVA